MASARRPDADASRRTILDAAQRCFSAGGFAGTSMSAIAAAAEVTQSLIHHHFGSKEALWREVRTAAMKEYGARIAAAIGEHGPTRAAMGALFGYLGEHPHVIRLCAWAELQAESLGDPQDPLGDPTQAITAAQAAGRVRSDLPARHLLIALTGLVRGWFEDRSLVDDATQPPDAAALDSAYLDAAWAVFGGGALVPPD
jgi:TetR/AcrR family transcriptional regulator